MLCDCGCILDRSSILLISTKEIKKRRLQKRCSRLFFSCKSWSRRWARGRGGLFVRVGGTGAFHEIRTIRCAHSNGFLRKVPVPPEEHCCIAKITLQSRRICEGLPPRLQASMPPYIRLFSSHIAYCSTQRTPMCSAQTSVLLSPARRFPAWSGPRGRGSWYRRLRRCRGGRCRR